MARRPRGFFKASPWELEDAEVEGIDIVVNHAPKRFVIEEGKLVGMEFDRLEWDADAKKSTVVETLIIPCDDVILAIGQENAFPWIERELGIEFDKWGMPVVDETTFQSTVPASSSAAIPPGDRRTSSGPSNTAIRLPSLYITTAARFPSPTVPHGA